VKRATETLAVSCTAELHTLRRRSLGIAAFVCSAVDSLHRDLEYYGADLTDIE
jgi:hypothetical protein